MQWSHFGVDAAYCINLKRKPGRLQQFKDEFADLKLPIEIVDACDGLDIESTIATESHLTTLGCKRSHIKIYEHALKNGHDKIVVFEDDCSMSGQEEQFTSFLRSIPNDWDWFNTSHYHDEYPNIVEERPNYDICRAALNTHCYGVSAKMMKLLLDRYYMEPYVTSRNIHVDSMIADTAIRHAIPCYTMKQPLKQDHKLGTNNVWGWPDTFHIYHKWTEPFDFRLLVVVNHPKDVIEHNEFECVLSEPLDDLVKPFSHVLFCKSRVETIARYAYRFKDAVRRHHCGFFWLYEPPDIEWYRSSVYAGDHKWWVHDPSTVEAGIFGVPVDMLDGNLDKITAPFFANSASEQGRPLICDVKLPVTPLAHPVSPASYPDNSVRP